MLNLEHDNVPEDGGHDEKESEEDGKNIFQDPEYCGM